jgi:parvulin-like peptidyl-prolyl isomerase
MSRTESSTAFETLSQRPSNTTLAIRDTRMTKPVRVALAALVLAAAVLAAGCGGGSSNVPTGAIAVVNGSQVSRSELDGWIEQAKKSYKATNQQFPNVGTPEYQNLQTQFVAALVQREEFQQGAKDLGITVTSKDIDKGVSDYIKQKFGGDRKKFQQALKAQAFPESLFRKTILVTVLSQKIFEHVTKDVKVTTKDAQNDYNQNLATYQQKASREVQYLLIKKTKPNGQIDFPRCKKLVFDLYRRLRAGASFAALAKKYSADRGSADQGGKVTFQKGQTVPEFEKVAFGLKTGQLSAPVRSPTYGYFLMKPVTKITPAKTTPFSKVENAIKQTLLQQKKQTVMYDWTQKLYKKYKSKISYAAGFAPPDIPESTATSTQ